MPRLHDPDPADARRDGDPQPAVQERALSFSVSPRAVLRVGLPISVTLALLSFAVRLGYYASDQDARFAALVRIVDLDREGTVPSWVSAVLLAACAASLWTVAAEVRSRGQRWSHQWRLLAVTFVLLSIDEVASLHERAIEPVRAALDLSGPFFYAWVVVAIPLVVLLVLVLVPFLRALPRWSARAFLLSGALYVGGSAGMEMVGGVVASAGGEDTLRLHAVVTVEELLELVGMTLFLAAVNEHRRRYLPAR